MWEARRCGCVSTSPQTLRWPAGTLRACWVDAVTLADVLGGVVRVAEHERERAHDDDEAHEGDLRQPV
eukprot:4149052-Alexandrium_andersonii.AAC.1